MAESLSPEAVGLPLLVGRYQLIERLGEGGMGVVWRCFDRDLEELVAIKFLREDLAADEAVRAYFRREVKLARRVTHTNVARVFEFRSDGGSYFLTMEFINGPTLATVLDRGGPLTPQAATPIAVSLCRGLAAAHTVGVVHGDIKPGNILLDSERGAVLTDFGISRALSEADLGDLTPGTPKYMAPELLTGDKGSLRSDVYAIGVVLFELLTGKNPWGDSDITTMTTIKTRGDEPDLAVLAPAMPGPWQGLIRECMRTDPLQRPPDARALVVQLSALRGTSDTQPPHRRASALATAQGPKWIEVLPFTADDPNGSGGWVTGDVKDALAQIRGLRVAEAGPGPGPASTAPQTLTRPLTQVRGSVHAVDDGFVVEIQVVDEAGVPSGDFEIHLSQESLPSLGSEAAAKISEVVDPAPTAAPSEAQAPAPQSPVVPIADPRDALPPALSALYIQAREALLALRPDVALRLYETALAAAPDHRLLQIGRMKAQVMAMGMTREPTADELAELRQLVDTTVAAHGDLGEAHLARAVVRSAMSDPVGCARSLRAALHRAPSLVMARAMMADLLMEIGRLPDAERHLDIACALDQRSVHVWSSLAALRARQGRFPEFHAVVDKYLDPRLRGIVLVRWTLGRAEPGGLALLDELLAASANILPTPMVAQCRDLIAVQLGRGDREAVLARLEAAQATYTRARTACIFAQVLCELACTVHDLPRARRWLAAADHHALIDRDWLDHHPIIAPLRDDPAHAEIRVRVLARADAVADAIWG